MNTEKYVFPEEKISHVQYDAESRLFSEPIPNIGITRENYDLISKQMEAVESTFEMMVLDEVDYPSEYIIDNMAISENSLLGINTSYTHLQASVKIAITIPSMYSGMTEPTPRLLSQSIRYSHGAPYPTPAGRDSVISSAAMKHLCSMDGTPVMSTIEALRKYLNWRMSYITMLHNYLACQRDPRKTISMMEIDYVMRIHEKNAYLESVSMVEAA